MGNNTYICTAMELKEYKDSNKEHRINLTADNGNIIYASTEGYKNKEDARQAAIKASLFILEQYWDDVQLGEKFTLFALTRGLDESNKEL